MARNAGRCPECGEPVSAFAAGCAICGTDLERHRAEEAARRARRPSMPAPASRVPAVDDDWLMLGVTALLVLLAPLIGLILAVLGARDPRRANHRLWFVALAAMALGIMVVPATRFGLWWLLA